jgi:hypothetical protein
MLRDILSKRSRSQMIASPMKTIATGKGDYLRPSVTDENQLNSDIDAKYLLISFLTSSLYSLTISNTLHTSQPPKLISPQNYKIETTFSISVPPQTKQLLLRKYHTLNMPTLTLNDLYFDPPCILRH